jgi:hypothetical protein
MLFIKSFKFAAAPYHILQNLKVNDEQFRKKKCVVLTLTA